MCVFNNFYPNRNTWVYSTTFILSEIHVCIQQLLSYQKYMCVFNNFYPNRNTWVYSTTFILTEIHGCIQQLLSFVMKVCRNIATTNNDKHHTVLIFQQFLPNTQENRFFSRSSTFRFLLETSNMSQGRNSCSNIPWKTKDGVNADGDGDNEHVQMITYSFL